MGLTLRSHRPQCFHYGVGIVRNEDEGNAPSIVQLPCSYETSYRSFTTAAHVSSTA